MSANNKLKSENGVNGGPKPVKDTKISLEDTITSLKCELRLLYETMKDKNENVCKLEKEVRDRDISIRYLNSEFKKLKESLPTKTTNKENGNVTRDQHDIGSNGAELIAKLERSIKDRDHMVRELKQKVLRVSDNLSFVQRESLLKDATIKELQHDNDKFRQVVKPMTKKMIESRICEDSVTDWGPGVENTRIITMNEPRLKRTAISAEPLSSMAGMEGDLIKIPKSSV